MRYEDMRLSLGARPPRSAGGEGCCERADAVGKTHAAGGRMPRGRTRIRSAALFAHRSTACHGLRHRPQSGSCRDRARLPQTYVTMGWGRRPQCEVHLRYPAPLAFRAQGLANAESWQDLHAVHDSRGPCSEKGPFPARYSRGVSPRRRFAGLFGCMARISCQSQLILNTRRRYIATKGPFSRPRPFLGYTGAKYCHRQTPGNA